ncbi:MAG: ATP-dependent DNA helicase [Sulfolobales archaeon]
MRFPYANLRKGQLEVANFIRSRLGGYLAVKAPTGYGKTVVALVGHVGSGRVLYVVRTRNEIAPVVREARNLGASFTIVFSGRRMCPLVRGAEVSPEDFWLNCRLLRLKSMCPYYTNLKQVSQEELLELLNSADQLDPYVLASLVARELSACPFFALSGLADRVELTIATYPYLFNETVYSTAFSDVGLDEFYVIVDEAHTLVSPQSILSDSVNQSVLRTSASELSRHGYGELAQQVKHVEESLSRVTFNKLTRVSKQSIGVNADLLRELEEAFYAIRLSYLQSLVEVGVEAFARTTSSIGRLVKFLALATKDFFSLYTQSAFDTFRLHALPLGYEPIRERLRLARGVLLMSGTLPPKDVLDKVVGRETEYIDVEAQYGHVFPRENVFYAVYTSVTTSYPLRSTRMFMEYAKLVRSVYESTDRAVLAVYPSYEVMNEVVTYLKDSISTYVESEKTKVADIEKLLAAEPHTLINAVAGGKIVEGVEFRDSFGLSLISTVVVCGIPYPSPDDYIEDFREALRSEVGDAADTLVMDVQASIRVTQSFGRAIRSEKDRAFIVLADRRYLKKGFKELLGLRYDAVFSNLPSLLSRLNDFFRSNRAK